MAKKYYYAVKEGRQVGVFYTWDDCKKQVIGYKGAKYKKFENILDANEFIERQDNKEELIDIKNVKDFTDIKKDTMIAYVDGSYNITTKEYGCGVVLFSDKGKESFFEKGNNKEYAKSRNVAGEILGSLLAMEKAIEEGKKNIHIYYDYKGIEEWAMGNWKTNNNLTKAYKKNYDEIKKKLNVIFNKVDAHTGDTYNEEADILAKKSVGIL